MIEELENKMVKVTVGDNSLAITKGYQYTNKEGKTRYTYNDVYYVDGEQVSRKHSTERGDMYYKVELVDVVIEEFLMKDGTKGSKTYPLSECPYLAPDTNNVDVALLESYLKFKLHR